MAIPGQDTAGVTTSRGQRGWQWRLSVIPAAMSLLLLTGAGEAPSNDIVAQRGDARLTVGELRDVLDGLDPATRGQLLGSSAGLANLARERLVSQILLTEARGKGWDQKADVVRRANEARDAVIVQSYLVSLVPADPNFPSDAEVNAAYEANKARFVMPKQWHLSQILVQVPQNAPKEADEEARKKAADLRAQAVKPKADFAELAKKNSQDQASAAAGGDVGWLRDDQLLPPVRAALANLPEKGITDPVRLPDGWHVVRLTETRSSGPAPLADVKPQLVQMLRQARSQQAMRGYVDDMLKKAPIQINEIDLVKQVSAPR